MAKYQGLKGLESRGDASKCVGADKIRETNKGKENYDLSKLNAGYEKMGSAKQECKKHPRFEG
jgi:hypothetical protein